MAAIAARAGVHVTTVSAALRNRATLPLSTRQRIQTLAAAMGYRPDPALSALVAYRAGTKPRKAKLPLAYITNWDSMWGWKEAPAHAAFHAGASSRAAELGYRIEHYWLGAPGLSHERLSNLLHRRGINGLIFASHRGKFEAPVALQWDKFAAVKIDFTPHRPALHNLTNDQRAAIQMAVRQATAAGYRRIGCVMPIWWDDFVDTAWSAGFLAEQFRLPERDRVPLLLYADPGERRLVPRPEFERWLTRHRPDVIVSYAPFVQPHFAALKLDVPGDMGFIDLFLTDDNHHTAGIRQNCHRVGELAVEMVVAQMHQYSFGLPKVATTTYVEGSWEPGSTLPVRDTHASGADTRPIASAAG